MENQIWQQGHKKRRERLINAGINAHSIIPIGILLLFLVCVLIPKEAQAWVKSSFSKSKQPIFRLQINGGWNYLTIGDWNSYLVSSSRMQLDVARIFNYEIGGGFRQFHDFGSLGAELEAWPWPRLGFFVGINVVQGKHSSDDNKIVIHRPLFSETITHRTEISIVPFELGAIYSLAVFSSISVRFDFAGSYYFARLNDFYRRDIDGLWEETKQKVRGSCLGLRAGVGLEYKLSSRLFFQVTFIGSIAKINKMKGNYDYKNSNGWVDYYRGNMYFYNLDLKWMGLSSYSQIKVLPGQPESSVYQDVRLARMNLSGFSARASVVFRLF